MNAQIGAKMFFRDLRGVGDSDVMFFFFRPNHSRADYLRGLQQLTPIELCI